MMPSFSDHRIDIDKLNGEFVSVIACSSAHDGSKYLRSIVSVGGNGWSIRFQVESTGGMNFSSEQLSTAVRKYNQR